MLRQNNQNTSIALEDLFKDRKLSFERTAEKVKQVFLFGNPGTGEVDLFDLLTDDPNREDYYCQKASIHVVCW